MKEWLKRRKCQEIVVVDKSFFGAKERKEEKRNLVRGASEIASDEALRRFLSSSLWMEVTALRHLIALDNSSLGVLRGSDCCSVGVEARRVTIGDCNSRVCDVEVR